MKNFDLVDYVHQMGRNNILFTPYYKGNFWSLVFGGTHLVYLYRLNIL